MDRFITEEQAQRRMRESMPAAGYQDTIMVNALVKLSWKERLLLLFRPLSIQVRVDAENVVGKTNATTIAWASRLHWWPRRRGAFVVADEASKG